jgi:hypothetical protein
LASTWTTDGAFFCTIPVKSGKVAAGAVWAATPPTPATPSSAQQATVRKMEWFMTPPLD